MILYKCDRCNKDGKEPVDLTPGYPYEHKAFMEMSDWARVRIPITKNVLILPDGWESMDQKPAPEDRRERKVVDLCPKCLDKLSAFMEV